MGTRENGRQWLEARIDEIDRQMDQIAERAAQTSMDDEDVLRSQLSSLRARLAELRARLRAKVDADDRAEDAALAELGRELDGMYAELMSGPK